eukprot:c19070_g1_i2.p1 GENE.c19070_g1_i2~~c19070_g1_i2.p1  ORF type:complete len:452 (-),score=158.98 c19070_g1_i2:93-1448(-)
MTKFVPNTAFVQGQRHFSKNKTSYLVFQEDGNLVLYRKNDKPVWASGTHGRGKRAIYQSDGNIVVYDRTKALWASHTHEHPSTELILQSDGDLVLYENGKRIWSTQTSDKSCASVPDFEETKPITVESKPITVESKTNTVESNTDTIITTGTKFLVDNKHFSQNQSFYVVFQGDGNFVSYKKDGTPIWSTGTHGRGKKCFLRDDGNIVVLDRSEKIIYESTNRSHPNAQFVIQNDGNLVILEDGKKVWESNASQTISSQTPEPTQKPSQTSEPTQESSKLSSQTPTAETQERKQTNSTQNTNLSSTQNVKTEIENFDISGTAHFYPNTILTQNIKYYSNNQLYYLIFQEDGDLSIICDKDNCKIWSTKTYGRGKRVVFQADGNLVVFDDSDEIWDSFTRNRLNTRLVLQDDGNLAISEGGIAIWNSKESKYDLSENKTQGSFLKRFLCACY